MLLLFLELRRRICIMLIGSCMPSSLKESIRPCYDKILRVQEFIYNAIEQFLSMKVISCVF